MAAKEWTPESLSESLKKGELTPLYCFYGEETFLLENALNELIELALGDSLRDFNLDTFHVSESDVRDVRDAIETLPVMNSVRVVLLKGADSLKEKDWEWLLPVLSEPVVSTVFVCVASKVDKRKKYLKRFLKLGRVVEFKRPFPNQIPRWIARLAQERKLSFSSEALSLFHHCVGSNLRDIDSEIIKLQEFLSAKAPTSVSAKDVLQVVSRSRLDNVFDLAEAIGSRDRVRAVESLANLLESGQSEVGIVAMIARHVRILHLIRVGMEEGLSGARLASRAGVSPFFLKSYVAQLSLWPTDIIDQTIMLLHEADKLIKSSSVASRLWLENLVLKTLSASPLSG